ncbi:MAG TPA: hypothetical protein VJ840_03975 [Gemmatimonadaceae bacterium]|nr:hypothetical protein [Gemmatimonadaceae bacterium]
MLKMIKAKTVDAPTTVAIKVTAASAKAPSNPGARFGPRPTERS